MNDVRNFAEYAAELIAARNLEPLKELLAAMSAPEILQNLLEFPPDTRSVIFRLLPKDTAADVFDMMDFPVQAELLESFTSEEALDTLAALEPDDRVHLLDELPARVARRLLEALPRDQRDATARLMGYEDDTVGRIMSPIYVDVKKNTTVAAAMERIRRRKNGSDLVITTVYVTDETRHLLGVLPLSSLITAEPDSLMEELLKGEEPVTVRTHHDQEKAARLLQQMDVVELPVLDREDRLVGILTVDDAMDVIREEVTDDMYDKVGLVDLTRRESDRSFALLNGSFLHVLAVRVPFLLITLAGGMLAGAVIDAFEEILEAVVATAIFIPVIMDMGGNVGTQSSTIFTRGMVLGQINMRRFTRQWLREVSHGAGMGVILGALGGFIAALWQGMPELGYAVGISLALTITIGIALGFLVPWVLIKLGFDQAAGADPIITTVKDMSGLVIYFASVSFFLPQVLG